VTTPSLGFVGLGIMGSGMATNLVRAGLPLAVWNRTASKTTALVDAGAVAVSALTDLASSVDILLMCLGDTPDVEAVVEQALPHLKPGSLIVDHSTIAPGATRELAAKAAAHGVQWVDAPVSGGNEGATNGTLSIMVGGSADDFESVLPLLEHMGSSIVHMGPVGSGQTTKLVNQILVVVNQLAVSEALLFAEQSGLDLEKTISAVAGGAAGSWMLSKRGPQMARSFWDPGFTIDLQQKDLRLVLEAANEASVPLAGTALVHGLYTKLQEDGKGSEGNHALVKAIAALVEQSDLA
jgi:3-hydroxyisobutyrate dehydrogenase